MRGAALLGGGLFLLVLPLVIGRGLARLVVRLHSPSRLAGLPKITGT
ncbi:MAG TPA: hypothetical protein VLW50_16210 [Streptosporangiaceae bacterium]|nr:hypothetical protein [Streptosporangiaceae bacterium]